MLVTRPLYQYIPVSLMRTLDNKIDLCIPAICTYGRRMILVDTLIDKVEGASYEVKVNKVLELAQNSVFVQELFDTVCVFLVFDT